MGVPVIGLTTYLDKSMFGFPVAALINQYIAVVTEAGGVPVMIPSGLMVDSRKSLFGGLDGLLLIGGEEIAIERFNWEFHLCVKGVA